MGHGFKPRPGKIVALKQLYPQVPQKGQLVTGFNPLADYPDTQVSADLGNTFHNDPALAVLVDIANQGHIQLHHIL